jgi:hypothetical protein
MLWARTHNRPIEQAPDLPESTLSGLVSGIVIEQEQIGPNRYIARLGVMFDRARTGQLLGVSGQITRSAPMLLIPVMISGSSSYSFEYRNLWQRAWAEYRTAGSTIDYVRTAGRGIDPLLLNYGQTQRRGRGWWRMLLDQYGAADILVAEVEIRRLYPGGPATGIFTARYGPDSRFLGRFVLRAANSGALRTMMDEGVRRLDALYRQALAQGLLRPDPSLVILAAPLPPALEEEREEEVTEGNSVATAEPAAPVAAIQSFNVQVATPDAAAVQRAEVGVSRVSGVASAITTSLAPGGSSVMNVRFAGSRAEGERPEPDRIALRLARGGPGRGLPALGREPQCLRASDPLVALAGHGDPGHRTAQVGAEPAGPHLRAQDGRPPVRQCRGA